MPKPPHKPHQPHIEETLEEDGEEDTLPELEREIGIADWLDPNTGEPAEGQSPPHLDGE